MNFVEDKDFELFLQVNFGEKLEEALLETPIGKRIKTLEGLGLKINSKNIVEKYISQEGYTMDAVGNLHIHETAMQKIYMAEEKQISSDLNIDISKITSVSQLKRIIADPEYREMVVKYGVETAIDIYSVLPQQRKDDKENNSFIKQFNRLLENENREEVKVFLKRLNTFESTKNIKIDLKNNENLDMTEKEIDTAVDNIEQKTIETNINNKETVQTIRDLYRLRKISRKKDENGNIINQKELKSIEQSLQKVLAGSQYRDNIVDENGNIDVEKAVNFLDDWEKTRNQIKLFENLSKVQNMKSAQISNTGLSKLLLFAAQAEKGEDEVNKKLALSMIKNINENMNCDLLDETGEKIDIEKVNTMYKMICDNEADIEQAMIEEEWNEFTANDKLKRVEKSVEKSLGIFGNSRDRVNEYKAECNRLLEITKDKKREALEEIISSGEYTTEQIVAIFYKFRFKELVENDVEPDKIDGRQLRYTMEHGIANVIQEYMCDNKDKFENYLINGNISGAKINGLVRNYEFTDTDRDNIEEVFKAIETTLINIEEKSILDFDLRNELRDEIEGTIGVEVKEIDAGVIESIFSKAAEAEKNGGLSKELKKHLLRLDSNRFKKNFLATKKETEMEEEHVALGETVGRIVSNVGKSIIGIPKRLLKSDEEKNDKKEENKTNSTNKIKGFFGKLLGKKEPPLLTDGKASKGKKKGKDQTSDNKPKDQESGSMSQYRCKVDEGKALKEIGSLGGEESSKTAEGAKGSSVEDTAEERI